MHGHTGGVISMGYGMLHCWYSKKNMNSKIPTEVELIRSSEYVSLKCMNGYVSVSTRIWYLKEYYFPR